MSGNIVFDREGGFTATLPDGKVVKVPAEQAEKVFRRFDYIATLFDDFGKKIDPALTGDDVVREFLGKRYWTDVDAGNLIRIARSSERTAASVYKLSRDICSLTKELKQMTKFWKEVRDNYLKDRQQTEGEEDGPG